MLERLLLPETHAISILLKDHDLVKDLFDRFEKAESGAEKEKLIAEAVAELKIHAVIEEEIFYPAVRPQLEKDLMNEADEEHHVARVLIAELDNEDRKDDHREAKFIVLAENVRHHIREEEGDMLPKAKELKIDFEALGEQLRARKEELKAHGVPVDDEHTLIMKAGGVMDTPAAAASRKKTPKKSLAKKKPIKKAATTRRPIKKGKKRR